MNLRLVIGLSRRLDRLAFFALVTVVLALVGVRRALPAAVIRGLELIVQSGLAAHDPETGDANEQRIRELTHLLTISNALNSLLDYHEIVDTVLRLVDGLVRCDDGAFFHLTSDGELAVIRIAGQHEGSRATTSPLTEHDETVTSCLRTGQIQRSVDPDDGSTIAVPIAIRDQIEGVLALRRSAALPFDDDSLRLVLLVAGQLSAALDKAHLYEQVRQDAIRDSLTRLYNHGYLIHRLAEEVERARRTHTEVSLLLIDVDAFKRVNDDHGHLTGDAILKSIARLIVQQVRKVDVVGRYGGEEFGVILPNTDTARASIAAERIRSTVEHHSFVNARGDPIPDVTVSIGIACFPDSASDHNQLVARADWMMYRAKSEGKNQVHTAPPMARNDW